jgi:ketopantoate reductase
LLVEVVAEQQTLLAQQVLAVLVALEQMQELVSAVMVEVVQILLPLG